MSKPQFSRNQLIRFGFKPEKIEQILKHQSEGLPMEIHSWHPAKGSKSKPEYQITITKIIKND